MQPDNTIDQFLLKVLESSVSADGGQAEGAGGRDVTVAVVIGDEEGLVFSGGKEVGDYGVGVVLGQSGASPFQQDSSVRLQLVREECARRQTMK